jgi:3-oxoacyl-[acyl-carrier protein] reductase
VKLSGKVAVITGAGSGIGRAIALLFAKEGADVVILDVDLEAAEKVASEIKALGREAMALKVDVSNYYEVKEAAKRVIEKFGKVDILVNNAGITKRIEAEKISLEEWNKVIGVDLNGTFFCSQAFGREMIKRRSGKIINISSQAAIGATPFEAHYVAAKSGIIGLTKALAVEWARYGILVNCICPGFTETPLTKRLMSQLPPEVFAERIRRIPLGRPAQPEDQAKVALFLASSDSDYITGQAIPVDGGTTALSSGYSPPTYVPKESS